MGGEQHGVDRACGRTEVFLILDWVRGVHERRGDQRRRAIELGGSLRTPASFNLASATGPRTRNRHGFVR